MATARDRYMNKAYSAPKDKGIQEWLTADIEDDADDLTSNNDTD